ncbi:DUF2939 domain-containing protein [Luteimonas sp. RIT-PG2_3]
MRRWGILVGLLVALLLGYVVAGPWIAIHGIRDAVSTGNARALARHVDFVPLRASLKAQLTDRLVRSAGIDVQSSLLGNLGLVLAGGAVGGAVDAMVTPLGIGALMEGHKVWRRASGDEPATPATPDDGHVLTREMRYRFESGSRFTATVNDGSATPLVFVLSRDGLRWRLSDIRLPPAD